MDMFYKIKALAESGRKIILHYFKYRKNRTIESITPYCAVVYAYKRKMGLGGFSFSLPYIVSSRINKGLIQRLNEDDYPILLEGIHCTGILPYLKKENRKVIVRMHNDEAVYYSQLAKAESNLFRKLYFFREAKCLNQYQKRLSSDVAYACISEKDMAILKNKYQLTNLHFIPAFTPWQEVRTQTGRSNYCLYHGNLSVAENERAAIWLITTVFSKLTVPFIIAGKNASLRLRKIASRYGHISLQSNPSDEELTTLIQNAQINILPSFNDTGVKIKLLHALYCGRFCITNTKGLSGTGITATITIADDPEKCVASIPQLMQQSFTEKDVQARKEALVRYNNQQNAEQLNALC